MHFKDPMVPGSQANGQALLCLQGLQYRYMHFTCIAFEAGLWAHSRSGLTKLRGHAPLKPQVYINSAPGRRRLPYEAYLLSGN